MYSSKIQKKDTQTQANFLFRQHKNGKRIFFNKSLLKAKSNHLVYLQVDSIHQNHFFQDEIANQ